MLHAVIMAGGSGTRFWPLSREKTPKQLLKIGSEDTLIQRTVSRVNPLIRFEDIFIVTNQSLADSIGFQLSSKFNRQWDRNFILEPEAKNTAPALGLAALHLERLDPESVMVVLSADHSIRKADDFLGLLRTACAAAKDGYLVTLGIKRAELEIGLHFESRNAAANERLLNGFMQHLIEVKAELGDRFEAEMWDRGWTKVYETFPMATSDTAYVDQVAARLAQVIVVMQPILVELMSL